MTEFVVRNGSMMEFSKNMVAKSRMTGRQNGGRMGVRMGFPSTHTAIHNHLPPLLKKGVPYTHPDYFVT